MLRESGEAHCFVNITPDTPRRRLRRADAAAALRVAKSRAR